MSVLKKTKRGNINYELCEGSYGLELWVLYVVGWGSLLALMKQTIQRDRT